MLTRSFQIGMSELAISGPEVKRRPEAHEPAEDVGGGVAVLVDAHLPIPQRRISAKISRGNLLLEAVMFQLSH